MNVTDLADYLGGARHRGRETNVDGRSNAPMLEAPKMPVTFRCRRSGGVAAAERVAATAAIGAGAARGRDCDRG